MIGLATIGQAPRDDIVSSMFGISHAASILQAGALDDLGPEQIQKLAPKYLDHPLVTRLVTGEEVIVSRSGVTPFLNDAIRRLEANGAQIVCVLCTGEFEGLKARAQLVYPDRILASVVDEVCPSGVLGVMAPTAGQKVMMRRKWSTADREVRVAPISPYTESDRVAVAARELVERGSKLIILDCMGYTTEMQYQVRQVVDIPVILANGLVGAVLGSIVAGLRGGRQDAPVGQLSDG